MLRLCGEGRGGKYQESGRERAERATIQEHVCNGE